MIYNLNRLNNMKNNTNKFCWGDEEGHDSDIENLPYMLFSVGFSPKMERFENGKLVVESIEDLRKEYAQLLKECEELTKECERGELQYEDILSFVEKNDNNADKFIVKCMNGVFGAAKKMLTGCVKIYTETEQQKICKDILNAMDYANVDKAALFNLNNESSPKERSEGDKNLKEAINKGEVKIESANVRKSGNIDFETIGDKVNDDIVNTFNAQDYNNAFFIIYPFHQLGTDCGLLAYPLIHFLIVSKTNQDDVKDSHKCGTYVHGMIKDMFECLKSGNLEMFLIYFVTLNWLLVNSRYPWVPGNNDKKFGEARKKLFSITSLCKCMVLAVRRYGKDYHKKPCFWESLKVFNKFLTNGLMKGKGLIEVNDDCNVLIKKCKEKTKTIIRLIPFTN